MRWLRRVGGSAAALALGALAAAGLSPASAAVPVVAPGHAVPVDVDGFAGHVPVQVQLVGSTAGREVVRADGLGQVRMSYRAPTSSGTYRLLVSGPAGATPTGTAAPPSASTPGDAQVIAVTVPRVVGVPFQVSGSGIDARTVHKGAHGSGSGALAATGSDLRAPLLLAAALGLLGLAATLAGRRRARS